MRVLITNTGPWGTGSGTVADGVMNELIKRGHEVIAFFPDTGLPGPGREKYYNQKHKYRIVPFPAEYNGIKLYTFPLIIPDPNPRNFKDAWTFKKLSKFEFDAYFGYMKRELVKVLTEFKPDVVECQHIWIFDSILKSLDYPYICVAHHSDQLGFLYDQRMQPIAKKSAQYASYIFAISDFVRQEVIDLYNVNPEKVIVIPNGYHHEIFFPFKVDREKVFRTFSITANIDLPVITFCGKISKTKGVDILLRANKFIQRKKKVILILAGCGELDSFSEREMNQFSYENVFFIGHRSMEDLAQLHNIATLSILPSRTEGFGIAALEGMACGIPVVASNVGGLSDFVVGSIIPPTNPKALATAVLNILQSPENEYLNLKKRASAKAQEYSWKSLVDQRLEYY